MRWRGQRQSQNVEDRRGSGRGVFRFPFPQRGGSRFPSSGGGGRKRGGIGLIGLLVILGLALFFGFDPGALMRGSAPTGNGGTGFPDISLPQPQQPRTSNFPVPGSPGEIAKPQSSSEDDLKSFVAVVLGTTEDVWHKMFRSVWDLPTGNLALSYSMAQCNRLAAQACQQWVRFTVPPTKRLYRSRFLPRAEESIPGAGRLCASLCHRS